MKFFAVLSVVASIASLVVAQSVVILSPPPESTFAPGDSFVVDVDRPDTLTGSREVSVSIGLLSCSQQKQDPNATCDGIDSTQEIGTVLYSGPYSPQLRPHGSDLFQNYTVQVPPDFPAGAAVLAVAHYSLVGAASWPVLEVLSETVHIVQ
ncbi:hypothetical protein FKP32DRAFT_1562317 [Trametes sanguinea]|nr:hypothetical protein FKP32DRAFT_1562317 [Trametes sanguinea]